jgi:hypothetical protein
VLPQVPAAWNGLPNSVRLLDPSHHDGVFLANTTQQEALGLPIFAFDPMGEPIDVINHVVNFGWEYVWHCHILSHEEMDMMRSQVVGVPPSDPKDLTATRVGNGTNRVVNLAWTDTSKNDTGMVVQRATAVAGPYTTIATLPSPNGAVGPRTYADAIGNTNQTFYYRVQAINVVGDTWDYSDPNLNEGAAFPTMTLTSAFAGPASWVATAPPAAPSNVGVTGAAQGGNAARFTLTWTDNANNETGFTVQRATNAAFTAGLTTATLGANVTTWAPNTNLSRNTDYYFRVRADNAVGSSAWVNATPFPVRFP